ncbi:RCC1 domain-containing protein [Kyrpidia spormannii]|uniref:RCC1-like domain-containing protein n=1 Tax=Kyrpidia spormannii TaxID=2055160 RepID=A0A6F9E705_9BACL|nr:hypothetical protein [Kyrpidia spormannii]CAB3392649.1 conserved exported protein of unknown function [Kyrpidia spormannii]
MGGCSVAGALWSVQPASAASLGQVALAAGGNHSLVVTSDGTVWSWENNGHGQLGDGTTQRRETPGPAGTMSGFRQISAGDGHTLALTQGGAVVAWGWNAFGQLGNGGSADSSTPVAVQGLATDSTIQAVAAGAYHSLALTSDGRVFAWGANSYGQLGDGTTNSALSAVQVQGLTTASTVAVAVAAGGNHSLALTNDGRVFAWGKNSSGQLGDGSTTSSDFPVQVEGRRFSRCRGESLSPPICTGSIVPGR